MRKKDVKPIVAWAQELLAQVTATRQVSFVHVRGHSSDEGNDRADALVQWGKQQRGYARLRVGENDDGAGSSASLSAIVLELLNPCPLFDQRRSAAK